LQNSGVSVSPASIVAGNTVTANTGIFNSGGGAAGSSLFRYFLSTNTTLDAGDIKLDSVNLNGIAGGNSYNLGSKQLTIPVSTTNGTYYILFVTDANNQVAESNENNNIAYQEINVVSCTSTITINPTATPATCGTNNGAITFNPSGGTSPYEYSIDNGSTYYSYNIFQNLAPGTYPVKVKDAIGCTATQNVMVSNGGNTNPIAGFTETVNAPGLILTNTSTNASTYLWDFGDGYTTNTHSPTHIYGSGGYYNVCLTAINNCGSQQACKTIYINTGFNNGNDSDKAFVRHIYDKNNLTTNRFNVMGIRQLNNGYYMGIGELKIYNSTTSNTGSPLSNRLFTFLLDDKGILQWEQKLDNYTLNQKIDFHSSFTAQNPVAFPTSSSNDGAVFAAYYNYRPTFMQINGVDGHRVKFKNYTISGYSQGLALPIAKIIATDIGYFLITMVYTSGSNIPAILKLDEDGEVVWCKVINLTNGTYNWTIPVSAIQTQDKGFAIVGTITNNQIGNFSQENGDAFIMKVDSNGVLSWCKMMDVDSKLDLISSIIELPGGNLLAGGKTKTQSVLNPSLFIKVNGTNGNLINAYTTNYYSSEINSIHKVNSKTYRIGLEREGNKYAYSYIDTNFNIYPNSTYSVNPLYGGEQFTLLAQTNDNGIVFGNAYTGTQYSSFAEIIKIDSSNKLSCYLGLSGFAFNSNSTASYVSASPTVSSVSATRTPLFDNPQSLSLFDTSICTYPTYPCATIASFTQSKQQACIGDTITFANTSSNHQTIGWFVNINPAGIGDTMNYVFTAPGQHIVKLQVAEGTCADTAQFLFQVNAQPQLQTTISKTTCSDSTGSIVVSALSGTAPFTYSINNGISYQASNTFSQLGANTYLVKIKDANSCISNATSALVDTQMNNIAIVASITPVQCFSDSTGAIAITLTGGQLPYLYQWSTGGTTNEIDTLQTGNYSVTVVDAHGCTAAQTFTVSQPPPLVFDTLGVTDDKCLDSIGAVLAIATGGTPPYAYTWSNGSLDSFQQNLYPDDYVISIFDNNGCMIMDTVTVDTASIPSPPPVITPPITHLCQGQSSGVTLQSSYTGGTHQWYNNGVVILNATNDNYYTTQGDTFTVAYTNISGCTSVSQPSIVAVHPLPPTPTVSFSNDTLYSSIQSGNYIYQWHLFGVPITGATQFYHKAIQIGSYNVMITDSNGCWTGSQTFYINALGIDGIPGKAGDTILIYPNPTTGAVAIVTYTLLNLPIDVVVTDMLGRRLASYSIKPENNYGHIKISVAEYASAMYMFTFSRNGNHWQSVRVTKK